MTNSPKQSNKLIGILLVLTIISVYLGIMFLIVPSAGNKGLAQWLNSKKILADHREDLVARVEGNNNFKDIDLDSFVNETQELVRMRNKRDLSSWVSFRSFTPNISGKYIRTNDFGFRTDSKLMEMIQQAHLNKKSGKKNIILLGGSTAFGYGVAEEKKTITGYLNAELKSEGYTIFNLAQGGYTSFMELFIFSTIGIYLEPDIIILMDGLADSYQLAYKSEQDKLSLGPWAGAKGEKSSNFILNFYYKNIEAMCNLADIPNTKVILALQPISGFENNSRMDINKIKDLWPVYAKVREVAKLAARSKGATFIDLSILFREDKEAISNFFDKAHLTALGQKKVADILINAILSNHQELPDVSFVPIHERKLRIKEIIATNYTGSYKTAEDY